MTRKSVRRAIEDILPLSPSQEGLLFHTLFSERSSAYIAQMTWQLDRLDVDRLKRAAQALLTRHTNLRVAVKHKGLRQPVQVVGRDVAVPWNELDLTSFDEPTRNRRLHELLARDRSRRFNLSVPPLLRFTLFHVQDDQYCLALTFHHILMDGLSTRLVARELFELYEHGGDASLGPVTPYRTYLDWLKRQDPARARRAWAAELAGLDQGTFVAARQTVTASQARKNVIVDLSPAITDGLSGVCRAADVPLSTALETAWAILLGRVTGRHDVVFGLTVLGRPAEIQGIDTMVGLFINTIPVRARLHPADRLVDQMTRLRDGHARLLDYHYLSLAEVQEEAGVGTLFDTQVVFEAFPRQRASRGQQTLRVRAIGGHDDSHYPLSLVITSGTSLRLCLSYRSELLPARDVELMGERLRRLLESIALDAAQRLGCLGVLLPEEESLIANTWNATAVPVEEATLTPLLEAQVQRTPDAIAVECEGRHITYGELDARANQLANHLRGLGVQDETRVAVFTERSIEMVIALLGVLKAGGAYVPVDTEYPGDRIAYLLDHVQAAVILTTETVLRRLPPTFAAIVLLDADWDAVAAGSRDAPAHGTFPESIAYVIHTSGSTGHPKGIAVPHGALVNHMRWMHDLLALTSRDAVLQKTTFTFDASVWEFYAPLLAGARLVMAPPGTNRSAEDIGRQLLVHQISVLQVVPAFLSVLLDVSPLESCGALRHVFCGGEALSSDLRDRCLAVSHATLHNLYGPAEATVDATWARCDRADTGAVAIGRPIWNVRAYLLDENLQHAPIGTTGELYIAGAGLARGYLGPPRLTAESFWPDAFGPAGARMYRTGDLARWRNDGMLEYVGRRDEQVKIRGIRIELAEIESTLRQQAGVRDALVVVHEHETGERRLVAYVTPASGIVIEPGSLRRRMADQLPAYMVPEAIIALDALPVSANGKLDRKALPAPEFTSSDDAYVAPRTPTEEAVCSLFAETLGIDRVGINDHFFYIGGHSLLATRLVSRMRAKFGREIEIGTLFENPTAAQLAAWLTGEAVRAASDVPRLEPVRRTFETAASFGQERLWFAQQMEPDSTAYHVPIAVRVRGEVDVSALQRSVQALVDRHESLRTTFRLGPDGPMQVIGPPPSLAIAVETLKQGRTKDDWVASVVAERFDLATGPLLRLRVLRLTPEEHVLVLVLHHIVTDGWSMGVLFRELSEAYAAYKRGEHPSWRPLDVQYADYAEWQRKVLREDRLKTHLEYWRRQLSGAPSLLELPTDRPRPPVLTYRGARERISLGRTLTRGLQDLSQREGATLFMTLLSTFYVLLSRYANQTDIVVGTSIAGRTHPSTESMIGMFFNMLPLRVRLKNEMTFLDLLRAVRQMTLDAHAHQDVPFDRLVAELGAARDLSYSKVFQAVFELQNSPKQPLRLADLDVGALEVTGRTAKFELTLTFVEDRGRLLGVAEYNTDLFTAASIRRLIAQYETLLSGIIDTPEQRLDALPLVSAADRAQIAKWNATTVPFPVRCVDELFENQVDRTPSTIAVAHEGVTLTYEELERRANQLAHALRLRGIGPEAPVALCMERSTRLLVAMLGILKAGGAYVALDPAYPIERLAYMVEHSGARLIVADRGVSSRISGTGVPFVCIDSEWKTIAAAPATRPRRLTTPSNLAYIYYTSGSTGRPKGVAVAHAGISNYFQWAMRGYRAADGAGACLHSSIAVDLTLTNLLPLFVGGRVDLAPEGSGVDGLVALVGQRPTWSLLKLTPTHLTLLNAQITPDLMATMTRVLVIGADSLLTEPTLPWRRHAPDVVLINEYGPTETVVGCSTYVIPSDASSAGRVPIGHPIANMTMYVLDEKGDLAPSGVPGELYIGGVGVARGYWNQPALTAERFLPNPFSSTPGARLYRSGDRALYSPAGDLKYLGRFDHQLKIRGYRVEPAEVEAVLCGYPGIDQALVLVREDHPGEQELIAYVAAPAGGIDRMALDAYTKERLPKHMVPDIVMVLDRLPVGTAGKIDRRALPEPQPAPIEPVAVPLGSPIERKLLHIWQSVLGGRACTITDDFFETGGDSMTAVRLLRRINEAFATELPLSALFQNRTVQAIACLLGQRLAPAASPVLVPIQPHGDRPPLFCVHPAGGSVACYIRLAQHLGGKQPVYGLQDPGLGADVVTDRSIEEFAALYVDAIREFQPRGPYHLGGWSFGGIVAFEIARQLQAAGESVAILALIDTGHPDVTRALGDIDGEQIYAETLAGWAQEKAMLIGKDLELAPADLLGMPRSDQYAIIADRLGAIGIRPAARDPKLIERSIETLYARARAVRQYRPGVYMGAVTLFRALDTDEDTSGWTAYALELHRERTQGWSRACVGPITVHDIPGNHATMSIEPHVSVLAGRILESLDAAVSGEAEPAPSPVAG